VGDIYFLRLRARNKVLLRTNRPGLRARNRASKKPLAPSCGPREPIQIDIGPLSVVVFFDSP
jgi:hypothetical protein